MTQKTQNFTIAIDGPAGSGKSSIARRISQTLNYLYLNSGSMYRAVTLLSIKKNVEPDDLDRLIELAQNECRIDFEDNGQRTLLNGEDVSDQIRLPEVEQRIMAIAKIPEIRREMVRQQQRIAQNGRIVAEGRDVTTVVFPNADHKFYITASVSERAKRRFAELRSKKIECELDQVLADIRDRDEKDRHRKHSPLKKADDAKIIDTTNLTIDEVIAIVISEIKRK